MLKSATKKGNKLFHTVHYISLKRTLIIMLLLVQYPALSQEVSIFFPSALKKAYDNGTRSYDGKPGSKYWSNHSDYKIKASLNTTAKKLTGFEEITYFNNSTDTLKFLVVKTLQDIYKKESPRDYKININQITDGVNITSLIVNDSVWDLNDRKQASRFGTNLGVRLKPGKFLLPSSSIRLQISWDYVIVPNGIRTGAFTDSSFFIGYWYPQMAVYDDYMGWDFGTYTGGQEMYNDLANYDVELSLPSNYIVWATGDLLNASNLFSENILKKIEESKKSSEITKIITPDDYKQKIINQTGNVVWNFTAKNVPDFAFAASSYYLWDAASAMNDVKTGKTVWVNSIYPPDAAQFKNAIKFAKTSIEYFSSVFPGVAYPYDKHYSYNGHRRVGMEFPMMANNLDHADENYIFEITAHEIAHGYLPFYVLTNETEYAWMDEGFVKLFGEMALENKGITRPDSKILNTIKIYQGLASTQYDVPLITPSSSINPTYDFATSYAKAVNALYYLIQIMEEKGVQNPIKFFMETWKDKHPTPYDFFFYMNSLAKEDLSWYWKPWFFEFSTPDLAIKDFKTGKKNNQVVIENVGGLPIPAVCKITYKDASTETIKRSSSIWKNGKIYIMEIPNKKEVVSVELGDDYSVDINMANNVYKTK